MEMANRIPAALHPVRPCQSCPTDDVEGVARQPRIRQDQVGRYPGEHSRCAHGRARGVNHEGGVRAGRGVFRERVDLG